MYPNCIFPDSNKQAPNNKQKKIGPAKSASSRMDSSSTYVEAQIEE